MLSRLITTVINLRSSIILLNTALKSSVIIASEIAAVGALLAGVANRLNAITFGFKENMAQFDNWNAKAREMINILLIGIPEVTEAILNLFLPAKYEFPKYEIGFGKMIESLFGVRQATQQSTEATKENLSEYERGNQIIEEQIKTLEAQGLSLIHILFIPFEADAILSINAPSLYPTIPPSL